MATSYIICIQIRMLFYEHRPLQRFIVKLLLLQEDHFCGIYKSTIGKRDVFVSHNSIQIIVLSLQVMNHTLTRLSFSSPDNMINFHGKRSPT